MDNAGENLRIGEVLRNAVINDIQYEYTATYTPQQNGVAERGFSGLYPRVRDALRILDEEPGFRSRFWDECASTMTTIDNVNVRDDKTCPYEKFNDGIKPKIWSNLRVFGEMAIVKKHKKNYE